MNRAQHDFVGSPVAQDYGEKNGAPFNYGDEIGTPFKVFLSNGVTESTDRATGKTTTEIVDLAGLIASILQTRVLHPRKLSGDDLRYIRSTLHMRSVEFSEALDVSAEHYSRCEAGAKTLSSSSEKFLRMYVFLQATFKHTAVQERLSKAQREDIKCDQEEAKQALEAFKNVFFNMKIEHIFDAESELGFSFVRKSIRPRGDETNTDCGKEDGKWQEERKEAA